MKPLSILFCAILSVLAYASPAGAQPASSDYQRGYSAGLTAGRSCAPAPVSHTKTPSDFSRGWSAGYAKGHTRCGKVAASSEAQCNPDIPAYSCESGTTTQPTGGNGNAPPVQSTCNPDAPAYSQPGCHPGASQPQPPGGGTAPPPAAGTIEACDAANPLFAGHPSPLTGRWYLYAGGTSEETWEFWGDSFFRHTWITSVDVGNKTRTSERGRFELSGTSLTLYVTSRTDGGCEDEIRHATLQVLGNNGAGGLVLDGTLLKYASW